MTLSMRALSAEHLNAGKTLLEIAIKTRNPELVTALIPAAKNQPQSPVKNNYKSYYEKWFVNLVLSTALQLYIEENASTSASAPMPDNKVTDFIENNILGTDGAIEWVFSEYESTIKNAAANAGISKDTLREIYSTAVKEEIKRRKLENLLNNQKELQNLQQRLADASADFFKKLPTTIESKQPINEQQIFTDFITDLRNTERLPKELETFEDSDILTIVKQTPWQVENEYSMLITALTALQECNALYMTRAKTVVRIILNQIHHLTVGCSVLAEQPSPLQIATEIALNSFGANHTALQFYADLDILEWLQQYISLGYSEKTSTALVHAYPTQSAGSQFLILNFNDPCIYSKANGEILCETQGAADATLIQKTVAEIREHLEPSWRMQLGDLLGIVTIDQKKYNDRILLTQAEQKVKRLCIIAEDPTLYNRAFFQAWRVIKSDANNSAIVIKDERFAPVTQPFTRATSPTLWSPGINNNTLLPTEEELALIGAARRARQEEKRPLLGNAADTPSYNATINPGDQAPAPQNSLLSKLWPF